MERRQFLQGIGVAGGATGAGAARSFGGGGSTPPVAAAGQSSAATVAATVTGRYDSRNDRFTFTFAYDVPSAVTDFVVDFREYAAWGVDLVVDATNFAREDDGRLRWTGDGAPAITVAVPIEGKSILDGIPGYSREGKAVSRTPVPSLSVETDGDGAGVTVDRSFAFEGDGFTAAVWTFAGPHEVRSVTAKGTDIRLIVPDAAERRIMDPEEVLNHYAFAEKTMPKRRDYDVVTAFVIPAFWFNDVLGYSIENGILITEQKAHISSTDTVPTREYARVLYGRFGGGATRWLTNAVAEYYGIYIGFKFGTDQCQPFYDQVRTAVLEDIVLSDPEQVARYDAGYTKGTQVLAALDVEIRERSGGDATLFDVVVSTEHDLTTYEGFRAAAVAAAGDEALADWLDTYVRTSAVPKLERVAECSKAVAQRNPTVTANTTRREQVYSDTETSENLVGMALGVVGLGAIGSLVLKSYMSRR